MPLATQPKIRPLIESRPPVVPPFEAAPPVPRDQLPLDLWPEEAPAPAGSGPRPGQVLRGLWTVEPRADLPDAADWSTTLAPAVLQAMLGQRAAAQLNRWLDDSVLAEVNRQQRRLLAEGQRGTPPVRIRSVRVTHPQPESAEVAAVLTVGRRPVAVALRLEACGRRWLCTAYELGRSPG